MYAIDQSNESDYVDFETFRRLVGASIDVMKEAIDKMPIVPLVPMSDRRRKLYPKSSVDEARRWIREHLIT